MTQQTARRPYRRILVTGASGFVGQHLMPALRQAWPEATITGTGHQAGNGIIAMDLTNPARVSAVVNEHKPDLTLHLAAQASVAGSFAQARQTWQINLDGSLNLFDALRAHVPESALIYISSSDVYGASFRQGEPLDESALLQPLNPYAASKAAADLAAGTLAATSSLQVVRVRPFNHSGAGQSDDFVLPAFAAQIAALSTTRGGSIQVGNLDAARDFSHVSDVVEAYLAVARLMENNPGALEPGQVLNVASGRAVAIRDILQMMIDQAGYPVNVEQDPARMRPSDIPLAAGCAGRLQALTGWQPRVELSALLRELLVWWGPPS